MNSQDSIHYPILGETAALQWVTTDPPGAGGVRLGPQHRLLYMATYHYMHCLRSIRWYLSDPVNDNVKHLQHCFNYLRQEALCHADITLEEPWKELGWKPGRTNAVRLCSDWNGLFDEMDHNSQLWKEILNSNDTIMSIV